MKVSLLFREWLEIETGYIYIQILVQLENQVLCYFLYLEKKKKERVGKKREFSPHCYSMKTQFSCYVTVDLINSYKFTIKE